MHVLLEARCSLSCPLVMVGALHLVEWPFPSLECWKAEQELEFHSYISNSGLFSRMHLLIQARNSRHSTTPCDQREKHTGRRVWKETESTLWGKHKV